MFELLVVHDLKWVNGVDVVEAQILSAEDRGSSSQNEIGDPTLEPSLAQVDRFGYLVADIVYSGWCAGSSAPLWREAFDAPCVSEFFDSEGLSNGKTARENMMRRAGGRGWVVYSSEYRSLRAGPTYFASTDTEIHIRYPGFIGRLVSRNAGRFMHRHGRNPTISDLANFARNDHGRRMFSSQAHLMNNLPWLAVAGWIVIENGAIGQCSRHKAMTIDVQVETILNSPSTTMNGLTQR